MEMKKLILLFGLLLLLGGCSNNHFITLECEEGKGVFTTQYLETGYYFNAFCSFK